MYTKIQLIDFSTREMRVLTKKFFTFSKKRLTNKQFFDIIYMVDESTVNFEKSIAHSKEKKSTLTSNYKKISGGKNNG